MVRQFEAHPTDYDQWEAWDTLGIPVLCLRGEHSDLLERDVAEQMRQRGPRAEVVEIAGCGHAPALNVPAQWEMVDRVLAAA
jgi:pimeloyl-ACP methyl ester carboxylesterase